MSFDVHAFRQEFPILSGHNRFEKPLIYFDNAATTQLPERVIGAMAYHLRTTNANVHRGIYDLSAKAEEIYESTRREIAHWINAREPREIILNSGTTEGINFLASQFASLTTEDEIILFVQEHHANILPWQRLRATIRIVSMTEAGDFDGNDFGHKLSERTRIVSIAHIGNVLGTINPIKKIAQMAHRVGALCIVDGAQSLGHGPIDVREMECDFFATSAHKAFGPMGIGFLYGRAEHLEHFQPYHLGGGIVDRVAFDQPALFREIPTRFEAGTPNVVGVTGLREAIRFLGKIDWIEAQRYGEGLKGHVLEILGQNSSIEVLKPNNQRTGIISFIHRSAHPHDVASIFDSEGIAVRAGHHCAQPLMHALGIGGTVRLSLAPYNTLEEIEQLVTAMDKIIHIFKKNSHR
ncbi:MAG: cysteine desulfurase [Puniceicoccales bacterium]|jgi:cysteine desulfurase/selenocysteine lyase|nr:cysteine desulfurase [Puniceicoccales bacterium]